MSDPVVSDYSDAILRAINLLCNAGDQALAEIDRRLEELGEDTERLKRIRMILVDESSVGRDERRSQPDNWDAANVAKIVAIVKTYGPKRPREIGKEIGLSAQMVGRLARRHHDQLGSHNGFVISKV